MKRLVSLVLTPDGGVNEEVARLIISGLSRSELKRFLAALRLQLKRRMVQVTLAGEAGPALDRMIEKAYPGRTLRVAQDEALGAGLKVSAGDDIVDASVHGYIEQIIQELGGT